MHGEPAVCKYRDQNCQVQTSTEVEEYTKHLGNRSGLGRMFVFISLRKPHNGSDFSEISVKVHRFEESGVTTTRSPRRRISALHYP